jgi:hypothetical protein
LTKVIQNTSAMLISPSIFIGTELSTITRYPAFKMPAYFRYLQWLFCGRIVLFDSQRVNA